MYRAMIPEISDFMVRYYAAAGRRFPWRESRSPFRIYLSEILLQRTRAAQVEPVFRHLVKRYPCVTALRGDFDRASTLLAPLGRACRIDYFRQGLEYLDEKHGGEIPEEREALLAVPGIGPYIAGAVRVFGFGIPDVIVDVNVVRVLGRLHGLTVTPETRRTKEFTDLAAQHVPSDRCVEYSYGILDFGASVCRPRHPVCSVCGLRLDCVHGRSTALDCNP